MKQGDTFDDILLLSSRINAFTFELQSMFRKHSRHELVNSIVSGYIHGNPKKRRLYFVVSQAHDYEVLCAELRDFLDHSLKFHTLCIDYAQWFNVTCMPLIREVGGGPLNWDVSRSKLDISLLLGARDADD